MTRIFFAVLTAASLGMFLACSGGGNSATSKPGTHPSGSVLKPNPGGDANGRTVQIATNAGSNSTIDDEINLGTIAAAKAAHDDALAKRDEVRGRNAAKQQRYDEEFEAFIKLKADYEEGLKAFKKATTEYKSLRDLELAKRWQNEPTLTKWYNDLVREFPGTDAAKEAARRLTGAKPKWLPVPPVPISPSRPVEPKPPAYEPEPAIPEIPTLAELRQRRIIITQQQPSAPPQAGSGPKLQKQYGGGTSSPVVIDHSKPVHVTGYYRKDGTYVRPHTRALPGQGSKKR